MKFFVISDFELHSYLEVAIVVARAQGVLRRTDYDTPEAIVMAKKVMSALDYFKAHIIEAIEMENRINRFE